MNSTVSILADTANVLEDKRREILHSTIKSMSDSEEKQWKYDGENERITLVATIDHFTYSSLPPKVQRYFYQWIDFVASIKPTTAMQNDFDGTDSCLSTWELGFDCEIASGVSPTSAEKSRNHIKQGACFGFKVVKQIDECDNEPCNAIFWRV